MVKHRGADASETGRTTSSHDAAELTSASPSDLVVLRALGKRRRMAKTIRQTSSGQLVIEPHDGRTVFHVAHARTLNMANILQAGRGLAAVADDEFLVRGAVRASANPQRMRRLLHPKDGSPATLAEVPRAYVILDIDGANPSIAFDPRNQVIEEDGTPDDPGAVVPWEAAIDEFIREALPAPFHGISCWWQFTASMGFKPGLHMRLLFMLDRPMLGDELKRWLAPGLRQHKLDPAVFGAVQQILVAPPILEAGRADPIRHRSGWLTGFKHVVTPPLASEIAAMAGPQPRRKTAAQPVGTTALALCDRRQGQSFAERVALIGDGQDRDGFHNAVLAAVGTWMASHEHGADTATLQAALAEAITHAPRDRAVHPDAYIAAQIRALPAMIADVYQSEQAGRAARALALQQVVAPPGVLPTGSLETAAQVAREAIRAFLGQVPALLKIRDNFWLEAQVRFGEGYPARGIWCRRGAVLVGAGIGKSQAAIAEIGAQMVPSGYRIAYVVPEHKLADDVCSRFNAMAGQDIARVWRGISRPDPVDTNFTMCRRPVEANLVQLAGGEIASLCGSSRRGSLCPHHPQAGGACAYVRQRQAKPQIWIVPAALLIRAVPGAMQRAAVASEIDDRAYAAHPPAFDLLVLDESPFLGLLGGFDGEGFHVPLDWLDPAQWEIPPETHQSTNAAASVSAVLRWAQKFILQLHQGQGVAAALEAADKIDLDTLETVGLTLWRGPENAARTISPQADAQVLAEALAPHVARAARLRGVQRLLAVMADVSTGKAHSAAIEPSRPDGVRGVRLRWREVIHPSWTDCPVLYLDATANISAAERWLGPITPLANIQAPAPHMKVVQIHDRVFGYGSLIMPASDPHRTAGAANQRRIGAIMEVLASTAGGSKLLIGPKAMIGQMQAHGMISPTWHVANFGALRGVDSFRDVSLAVIVSRPLPAPAEVERMAAIIFAADVQTLDDWYPLQAGARLMADGTGRFAEFERHPDDRVEAVRWLICEAEVQQAIGRLRGVRRTADNPVRVIVLNGVDLGPTAIDQLVGWQDLLAACGPVSLMAARGIVPKMWADVAAICAPRWSHADNPGHAAKQWFSRHREEKARLAQLWKTGELMLPWSARPVQLRRASLGLEGKNHRYVWLAAHIELETARIALDVARQTGDNEAHP
jgi:hypothetical protein